MRRFLSYSASPAIISFALLILRVGFGGLIIVHGYDKIIHFAEISGKFIPFLGMPQSVSLGLTIFAEFVCGIFLVAGLLTRVVCIPLIINMAVAVCVAHNGEITGQGQPAALFLLSFVTLLFTGAGKYSLDGALYKH